MRIKSFLVLGILLMLFLAGCGGDGDSSSERTEQREDTENEVYIPSDFEKRLSENLSISGDECEGGEMTNHPDRPDETCEEGQWLITFDDVNTCSSEGVCTEAFVYPIVGDLQREEETSPEFSLYKMMAISPIEQSRRDTLDRYRVKVNLVETKVVPKEESR